MSDTTTEKPTKRRIIAFFPFTFGGVAGFGKTHKTFLFSVQFLVAVVAMFCILALFCKCYFPVINESIQKLPQEGVGIKNGELQWNVKGKLLGQNEFLAISVDESNQSVGAESDCLIAIQSKHLKISNNCGYESLYPYPLDLSCSLSKNDLYPAWLAWRVPFLFLLAISSMLSLFIVWQILSLIYSPIIKMVAWIFRKKLTWGGAYTMAGAALMPGAVVMCLGIVGYTTRFYSLEGIVIAMAVHLAVGWIFLLFSPLFLEKAPKKVVFSPIREKKQSVEEPFKEPDKPKDTQKAKAKKGNPFAKPAKETAKEKKSKNPFAS